MKCFAIAAIVLVGWSVGEAARPKSPPDNPAIDMDGYLRVAKEAARHRATRRLSEDAFIRMSREKGVIVLDARSKAKYDEVHIKDAINLSFSDIAVESLKTTLPDKNARILIYCNNNFKGAEAPFPSKAPTASLNLSTYIALYSYGYRNVYELAPLIDFDKSKLSFVNGQGEPVTRLASARNGRP